ncbi:MAG: lamin tail domain-containing protein [Candidatus Zixiibacteriota bacterium]
MKSNLIKYSVIFLYSFLSNLVFARTDLAQQDISSTAVVILNEVLANEPGSTTKLEWVELFNADSIDHDLGSWLFVSKDDTTTISSGTLIPLKGFLIIARKLVSDPPDSISFEEYWGDGSGVWGDSELEDFPVIEAKISLTNSGGTISLIDPDRIIQSFTWDADCGDGISIERISPEKDEWSCCVDSNNSTPGKKNSVSVDYPDEIELKIFPNPFSPDGDGFEDEVIFQYALPKMSELTLRIYDIKGRLVKTLIKDEPQVTGEIIWDGRDEENKIVRIGIYIVLAEAKGATNSIKKMTLVVAKR